MMNVGRRWIAPAVAMGFLSACALVAGCSTAADADPIAERLIGGWRFAKVCQYERAPGLVPVDPCSPIATPIEWLTFDENGTASENTPNGVSGRYRIERRDVPGGGAETLLSIGGRNMGQLRFVGDTLLLGMAYVDGDDRYFVRMPRLERQAP